MATKKTKKKVIDGVVKNSKKSSPKKPSTKKPVKKEPVKSEKPVKSAAPIEVSSEDTTVTIIEADNIETPDEAPVEGVDNTPIDEPEVDEIETGKPEANESEANESETNDTSEEVAESIVEEAVEESAEEAEPETIKIEIHSVPEEDNTETEPDTVAEGEDLAVNSIMEEDAIDQNLDELISEIEATEKPEKSSPAKTETSKESKKTEKTKKDKSNKKLPAKARPFRWLCRLVALGTTGCAIALAIRISTTSIVPNKYLIPAIAVGAIYLLFYLFKSFRNKTHIPVLIILMILGLAIAGASVFGFIKVQETMSFLDNNFNENKEYSIYNIIVSKKSNYSNLDDVRGKTLHSISDFVDTEKLETAASEQVNSEIVYEDGIISLLKNAISDTTYIAVLNSGTWDATIAIEEGKNDYNQNLKVIGELKVEVEKKNDTDKSDLTTDSFAVYLSGIDTRSGLMLDRSLSDVNMVIAVNPKTKRILMTTIPRDYYVQLHGTSGLPDKLTHAGSLGGLTLSMDTIEDLLDFKFNRYIRVNFNFVINLVNAVGGITINSDVNYNITAWTDPHCTYHPGDNQVDGKCALAFARERYAYSDGDRHRGRNQEQVIEKIFNKLTSSSTLISKYSDILNSLSGSFDTNISTNDITSLANMQLTDMAKWDIETYNLDGTTGMTYTYSYPSQLLSVMYPDMNTVETAKLKIKQVLSGEPEANPTETTETETFAE